METRNKIFSKYIESDEIENWFVSKNRPGAEKIRTLFKQAANDYIQKTLSYEDFSLLCVNLHFEALTFLNFAETRKIPKETRTALEAFADPHGELRDEEGNVKVDEQNKLLHSAMLSLT